MGGHRDLFLGGDGVLGLPQTGDGLPLGVEAQTVLAVEVAHAGTGDGFLVAGEAEHGQGHWDGDVDTNLAGLELLLEQRRRGSAAGEDGRAVAVRVAVDQIQCFLRRLHVQAHQHRSEDLFCVALHVGLDVGNDGGTDLERVC